MINKLFSCFNIGTINQTNINNYNAGIKTQLIQIKRTFDEGKIKIAFNDLCEAKNEAKNNAAFINEPSSYSLKSIISISYTANHSNNTESARIWIILSFVENEDGSILL